jgi:hypothetical protein
VQQFNANPKDKAIIKKERNKIKIKIKSIPL